MQSVRLHGVGDLRFEQIPDPLPPRENEVTLSVTVAGICGSDLHNYKTGAWITRAPSVAGHEFTGRVSAIGPGVNHVAVGDRVVVDSRQICGTCEACLDGLGQVCTSLGFLGEVIDGGFAEAVTIPARNVIKAPEGVPDRVLAMAEPLAVALHALNLMSVPSGAEIIVAGCGPIGGLVALLATLRGHAVQIIDQNAGRTALVAAATGSTVTTLEDLQRHRFRFAIDTTGNAHVIRALLGSIAGASRLGLVGIGKPAEIVDPVHLVEREIALIGCHAFGEELEEVVAMLHDLKDHLDPFIADIVKPEAVPAVYDALLAGDATGIKTLICLGKPDVD